MLKVWKVKKAQSAHQRQLLSPTENTAPALPGYETLGGAKCVTM